MWPSRDVFSPGAVFEHIKDEGSRAIPYDMDTFYKGQVRGNKCVRSLVAMHVYAKKKKKKKKVGTSQTKLFQTIGLKCALPV